MIQINILAHYSNRFEFTSKSLDFFKLLKKEKIKILICYSNKQDEMIWRKKQEELINDDINTELVYLNNGLNYLNKINYFIDTDCEYSCSMDEDILSSNYVLDFLIENINILDNGDNLFLAPLISNGIPSIDLFINDFCTDNEKELLHNIFVNTKIDNMWGVDYTSLNYIKNKWEYSTFHDYVKNIKHYYKGIHPVRVSTLAHQELADIICNNKDKLLNNNNFYLQTYNFPYFCNSFYFIKTKTWKNIIQNKNLFVDPYDEVPLNLYMQNNNLNMVFVRNAFSLHMAYNTIGGAEQYNIEQYYMEKLINNIK
jgi:hypothetical protein